MNFVLWRPQVNKPLSLTSLEAANQSENHKFESVVATIGNFVPESMNY